MKWLLSFATLNLLASAALAQEPMPDVKLPPIPVSAAGGNAPLPGGSAPLFLDNTNAALFPCTNCVAKKGGFLDGTHKFDNFIGFMSNSLQNIDPRAVTEVWPIFGSTWVNTIPAIPDGNLQVYGAGLYLALSERLSVGMNQGGYAVTHFAKQREGWTNLGGFAQYTVIEDAQNQFLLTAGMRWTAPSGSQSVFQGRGPVQLAPYVTAGKAFGEFHLLATAGYQFPVESSNPGTEVFYGNVHLDRKIGWLYPLVEVNWSYHTTTVDVNLPTRDGFVDFGNFTATGNIVTLAVGANAVLIPNKLEFGAVYTTPLATQRNFDFNGVLVKMVYRY